MKIILISVLLFFEICAGFSLRKTQRSQPTYIAENLTDVYEIEEGDKNTVRFVYPKPEKPTFREITYIHVKEIPYSDNGGDIEVSKSEEQDRVEEVVTRRPFTNSHGFQFLVEDPEIIIETKHTITDEDGEVIKGVLDSKEEQDVPIEEDEEYEDVLEVLVKVAETPKRKAIKAMETTTVAPTGTTKEIKNIQQDSIEPVEEVTEAPTTMALADETTTESTFTSPEEINNIQQNSIGLAQEKLKARNRLFYQARGKYQLKRQETPTLKHKREISLKELPPAPTLPPLDLSILPQDVRRLISSTSKPENTSPHLNTVTHFNEEELKEELGQKIADLITFLNPKPDEDENGDDGDDSDSNEEDNEDGDDWDDELDEDEDSNEDKNTNVRKPRTYGMNLSNGRGYVWNDLLSKPGMPGISYDVGVPDDNSSNNKEETTEAAEVKKPESTDKPIINEPITTVSHPTESRPIVTSSDNHESNNDKTKPDESIINVLHPTESRPIVITSANHESDNTDDKTKPESINHEDLEDIEINTHKPRLLSVEDDSLLKEEDHEEEKHKNISEHGKERNQDQKHKSKAIKKQKNRAIKKPENDDFIKELMKNEQFWKWLSEWTATYMELLMKHIKDMVEDEVASQIKTLAIKLEKDLEKKASSNKIEKIENSVKDKNPDMPKENDKVLVDGKEIPITHTTNFVLPDEKISAKHNPKEDHKKVKEDNKDSTIVKHGKDKDKRKEPANKDSKNKTPTSIRAQNIYGNVVGSDKVTNIFVFYPHDEDDINNSVKPQSLNGANNIFTIGLNDKVDIDKRHPELTAQKDESTMTEKEPQISSAIKPETDISKPSDMLNKDKEEIGTENKEEPNLLHTEPSTTTAKSETDKPDNATDKKEIEITTPTKEQEPKPDQSKVDEENKLIKDSSDNITENKEAASDNKKQDKDSKNAEAIKADDKKGDNKGQEDNDSQNTEAIKADGKKEDIMGQEDKHSQNVEAIKADDKKEDIMGQEDKHSQNVEAIKADDKKEDIMGQEDKHSQNKEAIIADNKKEDTNDVGAKTESPDSKTETMTASSKDINGHDDKKLQNQDNTNTEEKIHQEKGDGKTKEIEKEPNIDITKEAKKDDSQKEEPAKKVNEETTNDSEK